MRKRFLILLIVLQLCCSKTDENEIDCLLFDPAFETIHIEIVDADGNNLIENGTFNEEEVKVIYEGKSIGFVSNNALSFETIGNQETTFTVILSDSTKDILILDVISSVGPCDITFYSAISAKYNNEVVELQEVNSYTKVIAILK